MSRTTRKETNAEIYDSVRKLYNDELEHLAKLRRAVDRKIYLCTKRRENRLKWLRGILGE
jgi:hypothetical protein